MKIIKETELVKKKIGQKLNRQPLASQYLYFDKKKSCFNPYPANTESDLTLPPV